MAEAVAQRDQTAERADRAGHERLRRVAREPFDLVMAPGEPAVAPLLALLRDPGFLAAVEALGGYSTAETGRVVRGAAAG